MGKWGGQVLNLVLAGLVYAGMVALVVMRIAE
jgi:hypothetical protein